MSPALCLSEFDLWNLETFFAAVGYCCQIEEMKKGDENDATTSSCSSIFRGFRR